LPFPVSGFLHFTCEDINVPGTYGTREIPGQRLETNNKHKFDRLGFKVSDSPFSGVLFSGTRAFRFFRKSPFVFTHRDGISIFARIEASLTYGIGVSCDIRGYGLDSYIIL